MFEVIIAFGAGVVTGWVVFKKPDWAQRLWNKVKNTGSTPK